MYGIGQEPPGTYLLPVVQRVRKLRVFLWAPCTEYIVHRLEPHKCFAMPNGGPVQQLSDRPCAMHGATR